jgi:hypothetical protein
VYNLVVGSVKEQKRMLYVSQAAMHGPTMIGGLRPRIINQASMDDQASSELLRMTFYLDHFLSVKYISSL